MCIRLSEFLVLPPEISAAVLTTWLDWKSLCCFDCACCAREERVLLLQLWSSASLVYSDMPMSICTASNKMKASAAFIAWARARKVKVARIMMPCNIDMKLCDQYLRIRGNRMVHLELEPEQELEGNGERTSQLFLVAAMHCLNLKVLSLRNVVVAESVGILLSYCPILIELMLRGCTGLTTDLFRDVELPQLKALSVAATNCDDECLLVLIEKSTHITCLDLSGAWQLSNAGIVRALVTRPGLEKVGLHNLDLADDTVLEIVLTCPQIKELDIGDCTDMTDASVISVVQHETQLEALLMDDSDNFTDNALVAIAEHCPSITSLDLLDCSNISIPGMNGLFEKCTNLTQLCVDYVCGSLASSFPTTLQVLILAHTEITDELLLVLSNRCKHLTELTFSFRCTCTFTERGIAALAWGCPRLKELVSCTEIAPAAVAVWRNWRPGLQVYTDTGRYSLEIFSPGMTTMV